MSCSLSAACCLRLVANWKCGVSLINSVEHLLIFNIRILSSVNWGVGGAGWLIANGSGRGFGLYFICGLFCCALGICLTHFPSVFHTLLFSFFYLARMKNFLTFCFWCSSPYTAFIFARIAVWLSCFDTAATAALSPLLLAHFVHFLCPGSFLCVWL